jgi:hypothetical protein
MRLDETAGEQLRRLRAEIRRLQRDAMLWRARGQVDIAQALLRAVTILHDVVVELGPPASGPEADRRRR